MANFEPALQKILKHEGVTFDNQGKVVSTGYVNHPDDPGRETNYGITIDAARQSGYGGSMREMSIEVARSIYRILFWDKLNGDKIHDQTIAEELADTAVNCGVSVAVRFLQRTLNVLNEKQRHYPDILADGVCGPATIETLNKATAVRPYFPVLILRALDSLQCVRYIELAERDKKFESFMPGWLRTRVGVTYE